MNQVYEALIQNLLGNDFGSVDNWFSEEELSGLRKSLLNRYHAEEFKLAGIGNQINLQKDTTIRNDRILWLDKKEENPLEKVFFNRLDEFIEYLNHTCFTSIRDYEFHYAVYEEGSFYKKHVDQFNNDPRRKYSFILYLNEDWDIEDGGELVIYKNGKHIVKPHGGTIVFFSSANIEHEVLPAKKQRLSLTGWLKTA